MQKPESVVKTPEELTLADQAWMAALEQEDKKPKRKRPSVASRLNKLLNETPPTVTLATGIHTESDGTVTRHGIEVPRQDARVNPQPVPTYYTKEYVTREAKGKLPELRTEKQFGPYDNNRQARRFALRIVQRAMIKVAKKRARKLQKAQAV